MWSVPTVSLRLAVLNVFQGLLAAAKPVRSTLDPKEGYKTKTGSTSSVTLTLTLIVTLWVDFVASFHLGLGYVGSALSFHNDASCFALYWIGSPVWA